MLTEDLMDEILAVKQYLQQNKINCFKYNHSLETSVQNFTKFNSTIQLSEDGETLIITNLKESREEKAEINQEDMADMNLLN